MVQFDCGEVYYFDISKPLKERYTALFPKYIPLITKYCNIWLETSKPSLDYLQQLNQLIKNHPDKELVEFCLFIGEMCSIDPGIILYMQHMYDFGFDDSLSMGCTSILVNPQNGNPYIVRNLDWDFNDIIRGLTINAIYYLNDEIVSIHLAIVAQLLVPHTIKSKEFAISLNFLWPQFTLAQQWQHVLKSPNYPIIGRVIYNLSISNLKFNEINNYLKDIILQHHGILNIIGKQQNECTVYYLNDWTQCNKYQFQTNINKDQRYLLTTNGDYFQFSIERYEIAQERLNKLSNQQFEDSRIILKQIALQYPNYNETTIFSTILDCNVNQYFKVTKK